MNRPHKSGIEQTMNWCKHFNGIQHEACKVLIPYSTFRKSTGALSLPCLKDDNSHHVCQSAEWYTIEEAEVIEAQHEKAVADYLVSIGTGKCPICKVCVTHEQVGRCVYGSCGHRLYQGTVNPKYMKAGQAQAKEKR